MAAVNRLINEHTGIEVSHVIPVKRIPKTTSGKVQRHLLSKPTPTENSTRTSPRSRRCARRTGGSHVSGSELEARLQAIAKRRCRASGSR